MFLALSCAPQEGQVVEVLAEQRTAAQRASPQTAHHRECNHHQNRSAVWLELASEI